MQIVFDSALQGEARLGSFLFLFLFLPSALTSILDLIAHAKPTRLTTQIPHFTPFDFLPTPPHRCSRYVVFELILYLFTSYDALSLASHLKKTRGKLAAWLGPFYGICRRDLELPIHRKINRKTAVSLVWACADCHV